LPGIYACAKIDDDHQRAGSEHIHVRQREHERCDAEYRHPDRVLAADPIADRAADQRAGRDGGEESEQVDLRGLHRQVKFAASSS
jgi:hypothetical protein